MSKNSRFDKVEEEIKDRISFKFPKEDRLHHRSLVEGLFRLGNSFYEFPFRVTWRIMSEDDLQKNFRNVVPPGIGSLQMMVTVPKKKRRHAVDRVLMRRRIREAYRLNRHSLQEVIVNVPGRRTVSLAFIYIHDKNLPFLSIEEKMKIIFQKPTKRLERYSEPIIDKSEVIS